MPHVEQPPGFTQTLVGSGAHQRKYARFLCVDGSVVRVAVRPEFRGRRALLVDVSACGIGLLLPDPLDLGTVVVFEMHGVAEMEGLSRVARVRNCQSHPVPGNAPWLPPAPVVANLLRRVFGVRRPATQGWLVGCEFDQPLRADELQQFFDNLQAIHATGG